FFFSSRRRHTRSKRDWSSDVCSSDLVSTVFNVNFIGLQTCIIFAVHLAMAKYPKLMHRPAKRLLSACLQIASGRNARLQLQIERSEERRVGKECRCRLWACRWTQGED